MPDPASPLSAVTTCKGRLAHLQETLPLLMALPLREVVVVDYDCPDGAAGWVRSEWPQATLVQVTDRPHFNAAAARNLGARATTSPFLFFVDVDTRVATGFWDDVAGRLAEGVFLTAEPWQNDLFGTFVVSRADFIALGGFDEVIEGWGGEDVDLIERLKILGRQRAAYDARLTDPIAHSDEMRMRHHASDDRLRSGLVNDTYRIIKNDLARQGMVLDEAGRRVLYQHVRQGLADGGGAAGSFEVKFRDARVHGLSLAASLRYELKRPA